MRVKSLAVTQLACLMDYLKIYPEITFNRFHQAGLLRSQSTDSIRDGQQLKAEAIRAKVLCVCVCVCVCMRTHACVRACVYKKDLTLYRLLTAHMSLNSRMCGIPMHVWTAISLAQLYSQVIQFLRCSCQHNIFVVVHERIRYPSNQLQSYIHTSYMVDNFCGLRGVFLSMKSY